MVRIRHLIDIYDNDKILNDICIILELAGDVAKAIDVSDNIDIIDYRYVEGSVLKSRQVLERAYAVIKV